MAINPASLSSLAAKLRSSAYLDRALAEDVAKGLSAVAKNQTFNRGLHDGVIADSNGGTKLAVGDNSASRQSISMQVPQRMYLLKQGAVSTRVQARAELEVRAVPAVVLSVTGEGEDAVLDVAVIGNQPKLDLEPTTGQTKIGNALSDITQDVDYLTQYGEVWSVQLAGQPFQTGDELGTIVPDVGQTIMVNLAKQAEKRTIWVNKDRRSYPRVFSNDETATATMVNGFCCKDAVDGGDGGGGGGDPGGT